LTRFYEDKQKGDINSFERIGRLPKAKDEQQLTLGKYM